MTYFAIVEQQDETEILDIYDSLIDALEAAGHYWTHNRLKACKIITISETDALKYANKLLEQKARIEGAS